MNKKKQGLVVAGTLCVALLLQACGGNGETNGNASTENGTNSGAEKVTLRVWGDLENQALLEEPFKQINAAFMDSHPDIAIQYDYSQNEQSLNVALQANELPDLFFVQGDKTPKMKEMVSNGFLLPLDEYDLDLSRYTDSEISYGTVDGQLYSSLPSFLDTQLVYYNRDIFEANNLEVPGTWDEFITVLDTLNETDVTPISLPGQDEWGRSWPIYAFASAHADDALNGILDGSTDLGDPQIKAALQYYRDFVDAGYFGRDYTALDSSGAQFAFTNQRAAMIIDGSWSNPLYTESGINLGRFIVPNRDGERVVAGSYTNFMTYAVSAQTDHPEAAVEYIRFLNSQEAQQIMGDAAGLVPSLSDIQPRDESVEKLSQFDRVGPPIYSVLSTLATPQSNTPDILLKEVIPRLMTADITGEEGAQILHDAATYEE